MADNSSIEWTDATWNPVTGCDRVSPGCDNCYALTLAKRLKGMGSAKYQTDGDPRTSGPGFGVTIHDGDTLTAPLRARDPRMWFINSMSDLFHPKVPDEFIARVFAVMGLGARHIFQGLTKRAPRMRALLNRTGFREAVAEHGADLIGSRPWRRGQIEVAGWTPTRFGGETLWLPPWPLPNVWLGVSVEDQEHADARIPALLDTPAAVRWLSCEPLLGPVDLRGASGDWLGKHGATCDCLGCFNVRRGTVPQPPWWGTRPIGWVVCGGESGPGARPMRTEWARSLRDQCVETDVPFLFKQWGAWVAPSQMPPDTFMSWDVAHGGDLCDLDKDQWRFSKKAAGRQLDGRTWDEYPQAVTVDAHA